LVKSFIKIARRNHWILLTATPGDTWLDYSAIFIANGWYKNITEFKQKHVRYKPYLRFPVVEEYLNEQKLELLRNHVLVEMQYLRPSKQALNYYPVGFDAAELRKLYHDRWNAQEERPIRDAAEMWRLMRRSVNSHPSRLEAVQHLMTIHPRLIVFYNFNYELDILRTLGDQIIVGEWNGHKHDDIPDTDEWVYLVQYVAGAEGWNCTTTDAMILYSLTYSYKNYVQARGRIDRLDSPFSVLYYYIFMSNFVTDLKVRDSLAQKQTFNERKFIESGGLKSLMI
jgi:superfamily II DNA or RNA helicase